ncbi:hypothetical protein ACFLZZ_02695 [Nanoarchaeota archaeon]
MKKGLILCFVFIMLMMPFVVADNEFKDLTGDAIDLTGEALKAVNASVLLPGVPDLNILSPTNTTYNSASLTLQIFGGGDLNWFTLNSGITNTSFFGPITSFTVSNGNKTMFVYANNSYGISSASVAFFVNVTVSPTPTPSPGGGGGGGDVREVDDLFEEGIIKVDELKIKLKQGESFTSFIGFENVEDEEITISLTPQRIVNYIDFPEGNTFVLSAGELKEIPVEFSVGLFEDLGVFGGFIIVELGEKSYRIPVVIEVESRDLGFDIDLIILEEFDKVNPGDVIPTEVTITSFGAIVDGELNYVIKDLENNIVVQFSEAIEIKNQTYVKEILIPENIVEGKYVLYVSLTFEDQVAIASVPLFTVVLPAPLTKPIGIVLFVLSILAISSAVWFLKLKPTPKFSPIELAMGNKISVKSKKSKRK